MNIKWFEFGKDINGKDIDKTIITKEYSSEWKLCDEPYYPINDSANNSLYENYKKLSIQEKNVIFGGRLGEYKDQIIETALKLVEKEFVK